MTVRPHTTRRQNLRAILALGLAELAGPTGAAGLRKRPRKHPTALGRRWYVDNAVSRSGDGTAWKAAWKNFVDIGWNNVRPGDTIYISGGQDGKVYSETLIIGASGQAGAPVTIAAGVDDGHAGEVTIDAEGVRANCIVVENRDHVTIRDITIRNNANDANLVIRDARAGVLVEGVTSNSGYGVGNGENCRCFDIRNCVASAGDFAVILQNCATNTPDSTTSQTDALWTSGNSSILIQNNRLTVANTDPTGHSDCIQSYNDISVTYRCNFLHQARGGLNNHGFIVSDIQAGGTLYFYNNIVVMGSTPGLAAGRPEAAIFRQVTTADHTGVIKFWNNTIYGGSSGYHCGSTAGKLPAGDEFKNNIVCMLPQSGAAYEFQVGDLIDPRNTDYNLVYTLSQGLVVYGSGRAVGAVRSSTSATGGSYYFEVQLGEGIRSRDTIVGIGNARAALTRPVGASWDSLGWNWVDGSIRYLDRYSTTHAVTAGSLDVIAFAFDFAVRRLWISNLTRRSGWNGSTESLQSPELRIGGYPIPSRLTGPYFITISVGQAGEAVILNTGATPFLGAIPAGFTAWGSTTVLNPKDIGKPATLTAPVAVITGRSFLDHGNWSALGYDRHGISANPLFLDPAHLDFRLDSASPARTAGLPLHGVTMDYAGHPRPKNAAYSLGAYQD